MSFDLKADLSQIMVHAVSPKKLVRILIIDDVSKYVDCMLTVLQEWQNVAVEGLVFVESENTFLPEPRFDVDILLLDESLGDFRSGTQLHNYWSKYGFKGSIVSITGDRTPSYAKYHFKRKYSMNTELESAMAFVHLMNQVFSEM